MSAPSLGSQPRLLPAPQAQSSLDQSWPRAGGSEVSPPAISAEPEARKTGAREGERSQHPPEPHGARRLIFLELELPRQNQHLVPHAPHPPPRPAPASPTWYGREQDGFVVSAFQNHRAEKKAMLLRAWA